MYTHVSLYLVRNIYGDSNIFLPIETLEAVFKSVHTLFTGRSGVISTLTVLCMGKEIAEEGSDLIPQTCNGNVTPGPAS